MELDYTIEFKQHVRRLSRRYRSLQQDLNPIILSLQTGETPGDQLAGIGQPIFKVRIKNRDSRKGKSGGYRMIYYLKSDDHITLLAIYSKSDQTDISAETIKRILGNYLGE